MVNTEAIPNMIFIAKTVPLHDEECALVELSPLLAFCALFEKSPRPAMVSHGITSATVYIHGTHAMAASISDHASLCEGIFAIRDDEVDLKYTIRIVDPTNAVLPRYPYHAILDTLFATNTDPGSELDVRCYNKVHKSMVIESKETHFMHRRPPYRPPLQILREWGVPATDKCACFRISCPDCLFNRWKSTSTLPKDKCSAPPWQKRPCASPFSTPPSGVSYNGGENPFNWSHKRISRLTSIW